MEATIERINAIAGLARFGKTDPETSLPFLTQVEAVLSGGSPVGLLEGDLIVDYGGVYDVVMAIGVEKLKDQGMGDGRIVDGSVDVSLLSGRGGSTS